MVIRTKFKKYMNSHIEKILYNIGSVMSSVIIIQQQGKQNINCLHQSKKCHRAKETFIIMNRCSIEWMKIFTYCISTNC